VGVVVKGSIRWIDFGFVRFQPSEIVKPFLIIFFADRFCQERVNLKSFLFNIFLFIILAGLVFKQPDLGNAIIYSSIFFLMLIFSKVQLGHLLIFIGIILVALPMIFVLLKPYQKARLTSFLDPSLDPQGTAYHQIQSVITVGSGQLVGRGIGKGTQTHLLFLPEKETDFVFASYSEEFGFVGDFILISCYFLIFTKLLLLIPKAKSDFGKFFLIGVFGYLFSQSMIHISMNIGILPVTGVTLPLFSYGGSSITSVLMTLGMVAFYEKNKV
jgi:rod shape determining protein RodA